MYLFLDGNDIEKVGISEKSSRFRVRTTRLERITLWTGITCATNCATPSFRLVNAENWSNNVQAKSKSISHNIFSTLNIFESHQLRVR